MIPCGTVWFMFGRPSELVCRLEVMRYVPEASWTAPLQAKISGLIALHKYSRDESRMG